MKKEMFKALSLLLVVVLMLSMFAGCGEKAPAAVVEGSAAVSEVEQDNNVDDTEDPEDTSASYEEDAEEGSAEIEEITQSGEVVLESVELPIVGEPVHYTCWMPVAPYAGNLINMDNFSEEIAMVKHLNEMTNVYIDFTAVAGGIGEEEKFNLMVASGDYCDILGVMNKYTSAGANNPSAAHEKAIYDDVIIDLYDDLQTYAPNYWNRLRADNNAFMTMLSPSGYMGCVAQLLKKPGSENMGNIIRKDWYLESGVPALDTVAQVEEYLTYCKDTYGAYAYLYPTGYDVNLASAFNITPGGFNVVDGTVIHSFASQGFKDYLTTMNSWYEKGLFNDSFYNELDVMTVRLDMGNNKCSLVDGGAEPMSTIYTADPENDVELMAIDYFKADGVDEVHVGFESTLIKNADTWSISTTCENHIPLLELVNWLYSKEAELPYNWGEEGITYELDDTGTPHWTDLIIKNPDGLSYMFAGFLYASSTGSVFFPGVFDMSKGYYAYTQDQIDAVATLSSLTDGANNLPKYVSLTGEEQQEFDSYNTDISTYADGMILKFITGEESMDNYDDFVQTCVDMGLEEMTALYQTAYERSQEVLEKNT